MKKVLVTLVTLFAVSSAQGMSALRARLAPQATQAIQQVRAQMPEYMATARQYAPVAGLGGAVVGVPAAHQYMVGRMDAARAADRRAYEERMTAQREQVAKAHEIAMAKAARRDAMKSYAGRMGLEDYSPTRFERYAAFPTLQAGQVVAPYATRAREAIMNPRATGAALLGAGRTAAGTVADYGRTGLGAARTGLDTGAQYAADTGQALYSVGRAHLGRGLGYAAEQASRIPGSGYVAAAPRVAMDYGRTGLGYAAEQAGRIPGAGYVGLGTEA